MNNTKMLFVLFILISSCISIRHNRCIKPKNITLINLFKNWNNALLSLEPEKVVNLYSEKSVLLATLENEPLDTREKKLHYFQEFS